MEQSNAEQAEKLDSDGKSYIRLASEQIPVLLDHTEARVRKMCSEILFLVARDERDDFTALTQARPQFHSTVSLQRVESKDCFPLYQSIGKCLILKISDDLQRSAISRCTNLGDEAFIALDDTTGSIH